MKNSLVSTRRTTVRLISYILALIVVLFALAAVNHQRAETYRVQMEIGYQRALNELSEYLGIIDTSLSKGVHSGSSVMLSEITSSLAVSAAGAKASLSQLPVSDLQLDNTYKFLSQLGDYAFYLNKKAAASGGISSEEYENLKSFMPVLSGIYKDVNSAIASVQNTDYFTNQARNEIADTSENPQYGSFSDSIKSAETNIENYPTLIYDGPYSDHIMQMKPKALENLPSVTQNEAAEKAKEYGFESPEFVGDENSAIEQYCFRSGDITLGITKRGGLLCFLIGDSEFTSEKLSFDEAVTIASEYLKKLGYEGMTESYYAADSGRLTINFAYKKGGVTYYPDLIKVTVALDTGNVLGVDARGYLMNHTERSVPSPEITEIEAEKEVMPSLRIMNSELCVIPTSGKNEVFCYEFHCADESGEEYLVYIDAQTGVQTNILILLYSDNGVLTK